MRNLKFLGVSFLLAMTAATSGVAQNPIIQTKYTADPTPMVYNDTVSFIQLMMRMMPKDSKCWTGYFILPLIWSIGPIMERSLL